MCKDAPTKVARGLCVYGGGERGRSRREEGERERQTERKSEIVGNVYVREAEKTLLSDVNL